MNDFTSWQSLGTYTVCVTVTMLITQFVKRPRWMQGVDTQLISWLVALVLLIASAYFTAGITLQGAALCAVNAVIVALASNGAYDATTSKQTIIKTEIVGAGADDGKGDA